MKILLSTLVVTLALACVPSADAQGIVSGRPGVSTSYTSPTVYARSVTAPAYNGGATVTYSSAYIPPYSYYAAFPFPARGYVGYGPSDQFPFYGNPYGYPYDRWTWANLSASPFGGLARYYYAPVR
jgi:hypothetical protein